MKRTGGLGGGRGGGNNDRSFTCENVERSIPYRSCEQFEKNWKNRENRALYVYVRVYVCMRARVCDSFSRSTEDFAGL